MEYAGASVWLGPHILVHALNPPGSPPGFVYTGYSVCCGALVDGLRYTSVWCPRWMLCSRTRLGLWASCFALRPGLGFPSRLHGCLGPPLFGLLPASSYLPFSVHTRVATWFLEPGGSPLWLLSHTLFQARVRREDGGTLINTTRGYPHIP